MWSGGRDRILNKLKHIKVLIPLTHVNTPLGTLLCMSWRKKTELDLDARGNDPSKYYTVYGKDFDIEIGRFLKVEYIDAHLEITLGVDIEKLQGTIKNKPLSKKRKGARKNNEC